MVRPFAATIALKRLSRLASLLGLAAVCACNGRKRRGPAAMVPSSTAADASAGRAINPLCHAFGGLIHGTSRCLTLDRHTGTMAPSERRVPPGAHGSSVATCQPHARGLGTWRGQTSADLAVDGMRLRVVCSYACGAAHVAVRATVLDDARFPALKGRTFDLGSGGFTDFVNVFALPRGDAVDFSIDFGVLD